MQQWNFVSTEGLTFAGFARNSDVRTTLYLNASGTKHTVRLPKGTPRGIFNLTIVLMHIGGQGPQDPPCKQDLKLRTHCPNETLWLDNFTSWFEVSSIVHVPIQQPDCFLFNTTSPHTYTALTPGYWNMSSMRWTPTTSGFATSIPPPRADVKMTKKALLVGDSTFRHLQYASSAFSTYIYAVTPADLEELLLKGIPYRNNTVLFLGIGLHSACYRHLQPDMEDMASVLLQMKEIWKENLVIRSTPEIGIIAGLDYNDKKCVYYTQPRLKLWNNHLRTLAREYNITFWDIVDITASAGSSPGKWAETDGTHYCFPNPKSKLCQQLVSMLQIFTEKTLPATVL